MWKYKKKKGEFASLMKAEKSFERLSHRYYFIVDQPPEQAFMSYMNVTRQSMLSAIAALSDVSEKELDWIRGFRDRTQSFKYKVSLSEKISYIKELQI